MRRAYRARADAMVRSAEGEQGFWPSYADMMSAVALILFFLMLLSYIQNMITGRNLKNTEEMLDDTRAQLSTAELELKDMEDVLSLTLKQVDDAEAELNRVNVDLDKVRLTLSEKEDDLKAQEQLLNDQKALLSNQEAQLRNQEAQLRNQETQLQDQELYLQAASQEIMEMREQMQSVQTVAVLRLSILEQIRDSIVQGMGDASKVSIGENGNIVLSDSVFFDTGSSAIKPEAITTLDQLIDVFQQFLSDPENVKYVDSVVISGHTDSDGSDETNRMLSTDRANAVLGYLLDNSRGRLQQYASYFCAAGYGETRPVADNGTEEGKAQNRRIEISIILKDDSVMDIVQSYLSIDVPESVQSRAMPTDGAA